MKHYQSSTRPRLRALLLLSGMLPMMGCSSLTVSGGTDNDAAYWSRAATVVACGTFEPMRYSKNDTPETIRQAKAHNAAGMATCHWKP